MAEEKKLTIKTKDLERLPNVADEPWKKTVLPLTGKLMTAEDPLTVGKNFRTLTNMEYTDGAPVSVKGMTKINATYDLDTYLKVRSAHHFRKIQPAEATVIENHILAQAWNTGLTAATVIQNETAPPAAGEFTGSGAATPATALWTDTDTSTNAVDGLGRFSDAPGGKVCYCNGVDTCLWGGNGIPVTGFITSTADVTDSPTNPRDFTDAMQNTRTDSENVAIIGGGIDAYTGLMLHGDGADTSDTFTDSSTAGAAKSVTKGAGTHTQIDTSQVKLGTGSILFDGTDDYLTTADHADFYCADDKFTFDKWIRFDALPAANQAMIIYSQRADVSNSAIFTLKNLGGVYSFDLMLKTAGANAYPVKDLAWTTPVAGTWYHIALIRGWDTHAHDWVVTVNGTALGNAQVVATTYPNVAAAFQLGAGTAEVISSYPPEQSDTYVKATSEYDANFVVENSTDPAKSLTGNATGTAWAAVTGSTTNQRVHIDAGTAIVLTRLYYENYHSLGLSTDVGVKNFTLWGSNSAASFAELTYGTDTGWTQLTTSQSTLDEHSAADAADPKYITVTNSTAYRYYAIKCADNYGNATTIGLRRIELNPVTTIAFNGRMDEIRWSHTAAGGGIARWTATFTPPSRAYSIAARYWLVRSPLPIQGGKIYVSKANTITSSLTIEEWNGYSWTEKTQLTNTGTVGGVALFQTGTFTIASTVTTSKMKFIEGGLGYWYLFSLSAGEAEIYHMTLNCPFQQIVDIWDGIDRECAAFFKYTTTYTDYTLNVRADEYDSSDATTYADLSSLGAFNSGTGANCVLLGFFDRQAAINIGVPSNKVNATAGVLALDSWDGSGFVEVGHVADGTFEGTATLAKPGTVSFTIPDPWNVFKRTIANNSVPLYYYRLRSTGALSAGTAIYYVSGIPAPTQIRGYKFSINSQDHLMLCCNMDGKRNSVLVSALNTSQVFNGTTSYTLEFGDSSELNCGCTLFSQYGSNLFNLTLFFKDKSVFNLVWNGEKWVQFEIPNVGCPSPMTLDTVIIPPIEGTPQGNRSLAVWEGADGVYISEGRHAVLVSHDIRDLWDQTKPTHINQTYQRSHSGWTDQRNMKYHLCVATTTGTVTTLDDEWVLDLRRWKWAHIDRGTGKKIQCGVKVLDAYGIQHTYGFIDTGYMERLEYGTTFDGTSITSNWKTGDFPLVEGDFFIENEVKALVPVIAAKTTTTANADMIIDVDTTDELMGDGTFTGAATNWTLATGWAYSANTVIKNGAGVGTLSHSTFLPVIGQKYRVTYTVSNWTAGTSLTPSIGGASGVAISANGTYADDLTATTTAALAFTPTTDVRCTIDDVTVDVVYSVDPTNAGHRLTFPVKATNGRPGILHSVEMSMTTSDETIGLEPFLIGIYYAPVREHNYS